MDEPTDRDLASRAAAGDATAFEVLVERWQGRVFRLAHRFFRHPSEAEDVAQEVFLKAWLSMSSYRAEAPFEHWVMRITTRTCLDELRQRRRRPETSPISVDDESGHWLDSVLVSAASAVAEVDEARRMAADLLERLPAKDRLVLVLMDLEGMSAADTAAATGSTRAAVKIRAMRARRALRQLAERVGRRA